MVAAHQRSLFAGGEPALAPAPAYERVVLDDGSWIDLARSWLLGADALLDALVGSVTWHQGRRRMYDRTLDDPRLSCWFRERDALPHPVAEPASAPRWRRATACGSARSGSTTTATGATASRSTAIASCRELDDTLIAIVTLGARRPFLVRPLGRRRVTRPRARVRRSARDGRCVPTALRARRAQGGALRAAHLDDLALGEQLNANASERSAERCRARRR